MSVVTIGQRRFTQAFQKCFEVESRSAAKDGHAAPRLDFRHGLSGQPGELRGIERLSHVHHVNQMVWHTGAVGGGRFGRAYVEAAINLHGVNGDDFTIEPFSQQQRDFGFADGSWAGEKQQLRVES